MPDNQEYLFNLKPIEDKKPEKDVSAIAIIGDYILVGSDEGYYLQVLQKNKDAEKTYDEQEDLRIYLGVKGEELDIEGIACNGSTVYVACSCSLARKSVNIEKKTLEENLERLETISTGAEQFKRCQIFRFTFDVDSGEAYDVTAINIRNILDSNIVLSRFMNIPSKENGVDIEGIAVDEKDTLYLGFRGPVLRGNYVPILVTTFDNPSKYEIRYLRMEGRGVREITKVKDGFLVIGGPNGDQDMTYKLYFWNGLCSVTGEGHTDLSVIEDLGEIKSTEKEPKIDGSDVDGKAPTVVAKAEGLDVLQETPNGYRVLIAFDSFKNGQPEEFTFKKK